MVVVGKVETARRRHGMELVVGQAAAERPARGAARTIEPVAGIRHPVQLKHGAQAPLVEGRVVRHERQPLDTGRNLLPHVGEIGRLGRILVAEAVDGRGETAVKIRTRADQAVKRVDHLAATHHDDAHRTDARTPAVGRLEIYGCKIFHRSGVNILRKDTDFNASRYRRQRKNGRLSRAAVVSAGAGYSVYSSSDVSGVTHESAGVSSSTSASVRKASLSNMMSSK